MNNVILYEKYNVLKALSRNSTGEVFLAEHTMLHTYRILKRLRKADPCYGELKKEAGILKHLKHPCIPALYDVLEDEGYLILVEQYMEGESLKVFCERGEGLSEELILELAVQICDIMHYLHSSENQLLYLDLKPDNLLISGNILSLVDFGAAVSAVDLANRRYGFGTPEFAAPELIRGEAVSVRTDIYSIGRLIAWMLEGRDAKQSLNGSIPVHWSRKSARSAIENIINTCTAQSPEGRYAAVTDLKRDLLEAAAKRKGKRKDNRVITEHFGRRKSGETEPADGSTKGGRKGQPKKGRIGVYGVHRMAGTTCTAIQLALFLKTRWGKKVSVAILEMSGREDLKMIEDWYFGADDRNCGEFFTIRGVDFWKNVTEEKALSLFNRGYDYLILDLGSGERGRKELLRCQEKLIIGSGVPWRVQEWREYFRVMGGMGTTGDWHYIRLAGGAGGVMSRQDDIRIHEMPQLTSVLKGTKESEELFAKIF